MFTSLQQQDAHRENAGVKSAVRALPLNVIDALLLGLLIIPTLSGVILIV